MNVRKTNCKRHFPKQKLIYLINFSFLEFNITIISLVSMFHNLHTNINYLKLTNILELLTLNKLHITQFTNHISIILSIFTIVSIYFNV